MSMPLISCDVSAPIANPHVPDQSLPICRQPRALLVPGNAGRRNTHGRLECQGTLCNRMKSFRPSPPENFWVQILSK